jgi:hypothetical protein
VATERRRMHATGADPSPAVHAVSAGGNCLPADARCPSTSHRLLSSLAHTGDSSMARACCAGLHGCCLSVRADRQRCVEVVHGAGQRGRSFQLSHGAKPQTLRVSVFRSVCVKAGCCPMHFILGLLAPVSSSPSLSSCFPSTYTLNPIRSASVSCSPARHWPQEAPR